MVFEGHGWKSCSGWSGWPGWVAADNGVTNKEKSFRW